MINKVYEKMEQYIKQNYIFLIFLIIFYFVCTFPVPYYINTPGGIINIENRINIENAYEYEGSFNLSYVTELRGTVVTYLLSHVIKDWDLVKETDIVLDNETISDVNFRNNMFLHESEQNATYVAYTKANKEYTVTNSGLYIVYIDKQANTDLKIQDQIISVNDINVKTVDEYVNLINTYKVGETVTLKVKNNKKEYTRNAEVIKYNNSQILGIMIMEKHEYKTNPKIEFNFNKSESGPSGGLILTLSIYNKLIKEDITKGKVIAGTGTIDILGNVGEISGVEYKLKGAVKANADIFIVPNGSNYEDAIKLKKEKNYQIEIVGVDTFDEALNYLKSI